MKIKNLRDVGSILEVEVKDESPVDNYQIDSRKAGVGTLFFALPGAKTDGHSFLEEVRKKGAVGAVVRKDYVGLDFGLILIRVENVLGALHLLAKESVNRSSAQIIAITGSMGKTTTKDFIATLLEKKFRVGKTFASYNTQLTLPLTVLNMEENADVYVLEMGMGKVGDLAKLIEIAPPDIAVLTNVTMAHYGDYFSSIREVALAKAEIFQHAKLKQAIFYDSFLERKQIKDSVEKITFSIEDSRADYFIGDRDFIDEKGIRACKLEIPFPEVHVRHNLLCAIAVARTMSLSWEEIGQGLSRLKLPKMRFEKIEKNGVLFINDAFNANPESVKMALSSLPSPQNGGKRIAVLGSMADLGPFSKSSHIEVGRKASEFVDYLLSLGDEAIWMEQAFLEKKKSAEHFTRLEDLSKRLKQLIKPGDVVLVKGSRFLEMEKILTELEVDRC